MRAIFKEIGLQGHKTFISIIGENNDNYYWWVFWSCSFLFIIVGFIIYELFQVSYIRDINHRLTDFLNVKPFGIIDFVITVTIELLKIFIALPLIILIGGIIPIIIFHICNFIFTDVNLNFVILFGLLLNILEVFLIFRLVKSWKN